MIQVTRLNGSRLYVNADKILFVEPTPDTVVSLINGDRVPVRESPQEIVELVVAYLHRIHSGAETVAADQSSASVDSPAGHY